MTKNDETRSPVLGYVAIATAVLIWAGWAIATRAAMTERQDPLDIALFRYLTPALILFPFVWRKGIFPKGENPLHLIVMTVGWGGPFVLLISNGLKTVEAALFGPFVPGLLPLVVAFWGVLVEGDRMRAGRKLGLMLIALALALVVVPAVVRGDSGILTGAPWLVCACFGWSAFTIAFRRTRLTGVEAAAYVCLYSSPFLIAAAAIFGTGVFEYSWRQAAFQVLVQGVLSGAISVAAFGYAIQSLGIARASAITSLVPVCAALGGWMLLGEGIGVNGWAAAGLACVGVLLVNRAPA